MLLFLFLRKVMEIILEPIRTLKNVFQEAFCYSIQIHFSKVNSATLLNGFLKTGKKSSLKYIIKMGN